MSTPNSLLKPIYLDNNATTRCAPEAVAAMLPFFTEQFGNPSSMHSFGAKVGHAVKAARASLQKLLGAEYDSEIIYTSGGSEAALQPDPHVVEVVVTGEPAEAEHPGDEVDAVRSGSHRSATNTPGAPRSVEGNRRRERKIEAYLRAV